MLIATIREIFTRPSAWIYLLLVAGGMASGAWVAAAVKGFDQQYDVAHLAMPADLATIVIIVGAAMLASSAHSRGHIGYAYLANNNRGAEHVMRLVLIVGAFVFAGGVGMVFGYLGMSVLGAEVDLSTFSDRGNAGGYVWSALVQWAVMAFLSAATGVLLRSGIGSLMVWIADYFFIEVSLALVGTDWARTLLAGLPMTASRTVGIGSVPYADGTALGATAVVIAWAVVLGLAGYLVVRRRPVN